MKSAILVLFLTGCATVDPPTYCIGGFQHSYAAASGYRQVWSEQWVGVPCESAKK